MQNGIILEALHKLTTTFAYLKGGAYYTAICEYVVEYFDVDCAFVTEFNHELANATLLAGWYSEQPLKSFEYSLTFSPCEDVINKEFALYPQEVQKHFPNDTLIQKLQIEAYGGIILLNSSQEAMGVLVLASQKPFEDTLLITQILKLYRHTLSAELERNANENNQSNLEQIAYYDPPYQTSQSITDYRSYSPSDQKPSTGTQYCCHLLDGLGWL